MTPSRSDILNEPAGPSLDALVAEHVMGINPRNVRVCGSDEFVTVYNDNPALSDGIWEMKDILIYGRPKEYSTDIAAAWEVVEKLHSQDLWLYFSVDAYGANAGFCKRSVQPDWKCAVMGEPAPLAICRAALLSVIQ